MLSINYSQRWSEIILLHYSNFARFPSQRRYDKENQISNLSNTNKPIMLDPPLLQEGLISLKLWVPAMPFRGFRTCFHGHPTRFSFGWSERQNIIAIGFVWKLYPHFYNIIAVQGWRKLNIFSWGLTLSWVWLCELPVYRYDVCSILLSLLYSCLAQACHYGDCVWER